MTEHLAQNSAEWFEARKGRITASRAPAILGFSQYRSREDVMREMVREAYGYEAEFQGNAATQWGTDNEPQARLEYEFDTGSEVSETGLVAHPEYPWLAASPDGLVEGGGYLEIKCPYSRKLESKPEWEVQVQFGLHVTGCDWGHLFIWTPEDTKIVTIIRDEHFLERHWDDFLTFRAEYESYMEGESVAAPYLEPEVVERDDTLWANWAEEFVEAKQEKEEAERKMKEAKERLVELAGDKATHGGGVKVTPITKSGGYDYRKAAEAAGADLDQYKKPDRTEYRVTTDD